MSADDGRFERGNLVGNVNVPAVILPTIHGTVRRHDPDGSHAQPFFSGLSGTSLSIDIGVFGSAPTTYVVNFATDNYHDAVVAVNAVSPANFKWLESDGFAAIQSQHAGGKNFIAISAGTAVTALGLQIAPVPGSYSQAGDLVTSPSSKVQRNPQTTELLSYDENLTTLGVNRAILGALLNTDRRLNDLDKEFIVYKVLDAQQYSSIGFTASDTVRLSGTPTDRISIQAIMNALQERQVVGLLTNDAYPVPAYASSGDPIQVIGVSYGPSDTASPTSQGVGWGSPPSNPGAVLDGTLAQSFKVQLINITTIVGSIIVATGAQFVTNKVAPNDVVTIQGATNVIPFSHDGEFVVVQVIDEDTIVVRAMGSNEPLVDSTEDKPRSLNTNLPASTAYGQVGVYVGWSITGHGPTGSTTDCIFFKTNGSLSSGTNWKVKVPVAVTLREVASELLLPNTAYDQDPQVALQNRINAFIKLNSFSEGVKLKSTTPDLFSGLQLARIQADISDGQTDINNTLMWDTTGFTGTTSHVRLYLQKGTGKFILTENAKFNPISGGWQQDDAAVPSSRFDFGKSDFSGYRINAGSSAATDAWPITLFQFPTVNLISDGTTARLRLPVPPSSSVGGNYYLLLEQKSPDQGGGVFFYTRLYYVAGVGGGVTGGLVVTTNASWDGANWNKDVLNNLAVRYALTYLGFKMEGREQASNTAWNDSGWNRVTSAEMNIFSQFFSFLGASVQLGPDVSTTVPNPAITTSSLTYSPSRLALYQDTDINGRHLTIYISASKMEIALGCLWNQSLAKWVSDDAGVNGGGSLVVFYGGGTSGRYLYKTPVGGGSADNWTDALPPTAGGWDTIPLEISPGAATVDGSLALGTSAVSTGTLARTARLITKLATVGSSGDTALGLTLIWESQSAALSGPKYRLYAGLVNNEIRFTVNARWDGTDWNKDVNGTAASSYSMNTDTLLVLVRGATDNTAWTDAQWTGTGNVTTETALLKPNATSDVPLITSQDKNSHNRWELEHCGFPDGRWSEFREDWTIQHNTGSAINSGTNYLPGNSKWQYDTNVSPGINLIQPPLGTNANFFRCELNSGGAGGNRTYLSSALGWPLVLDDVVMVLSFSLCLPDASTSPGASFAFGLAKNGSVDLTLAATDGYFFRKNDGTATWNAVVNSGGSNRADVASGATMTNNLGNRFKIEVHGANTAEGARAKFYANGTLVLNQSTNLVSSTTLVLAGMAKEVSANKTLGIGPVWLRWNHLLSPELV